MHACMYVCVTCHSACMQTSWLMAVYRSATTSVSPEWLIHRYASQVLRAKWCHTMPCITRHRPAQHGIIMDIYLVLSTYRPAAFINHATGLNAPHATPPASWRSSLPTAAQQQGSRKPSSGPTGGARTPRRYQECVHSMANAAPWTRMASSMSVVLAWMTSATRTAARRFAECAVQKGRITKNR